MQGEALRHYYNAVLLECETFEPWRCEFYLNMLEHNLKGSKLTKFQSRLVLTLYSVYYSQKKIDVK